MVQLGILCLPIVTEVEPVGLALDFRDFFGLRLLGEPLPHRAGDDEPFFRAPVAGVAEAVLILHINEAFALKDYHVIN
ncbi:hypothetical protein D3C87_1828620 [compost metagenome]